MSSSREMRRCRTLETTDTRPLLISRFERRRENARSSSSPSSSSSIRLELMVISANRLMVPGPMGRSGIRYHEAGGCSHPAFSA